MYRPGADRRSVLGHGRPVGSAVDHLVDVYSGRVLEFAPGDTTVIRAVYRLAGSKRDFTALMYVEPTGPIGTLTGVVTDGWCKGHLVRGEYTEIQHEHDGTSTDAWQGSLDIVDATVDVRAGDLAHSS